MVLKKTVTYGKLALVAVFYLEIIRRMVNVDFNFRLLDDVIGKLLNEFNAVKKDFVGGYVGADSLQGVFDRLFSAIKVYDAFINVRIACIDDVIYNDNQLTLDGLDDLMEERENMSGNIYLHKKIKESISYEYKKLIGEKPDVDYDNENEPGIED